MSTRRIFLTLGGGFAAVATWRLSAPWISDRLAGDFVFEPIAGAPEFRRIVRDEPVSGVVNDPLIGLGSDQIASAAPDVDLALDLFDLTLSGLPVAVFSDYNCPYCRILERNLAQAKTKWPLAINILNLPLLGDGSLLGAQASIAAGLQGKFRQMHSRLMESRLVITDGYIETIAGQIDIDYPKLQKDMAGPEIKSQLDRNRAMADRFRVAGTPSTIIGRSFFAGAMSQRRLENLIALETP